jgi:hypothetical protein
MAEVLRPGRTEPKRNPGHGILRHSVGLERAAKLVGRSCAVSGSPFPPPKTARTVVDNESRLEANLAGLLPKIAEGIPQATFCPRAPKTVF